tara:strand:- start:18 stop:1520 length:1503 start_codon:yes stop_codon:yes gene_type:complete
MKKTAFLPLVALFSFLLLLSCSTDDGIVIDDVQETITNDSQLFNLLNRIPESSNTPNSISCIDFQYPITFLIFDSNNQQTGSQTVNNDVELLLFITNIEPNTTISIEFPISVILQNGSVVQVNNNQELQNLILECDLSGGDVPTNFSEILTEGVWYVSYYFDDTDETSDFAGYEFDFATDNTATATVNNSTTNGTWNITTGSTPDLVLFFGESDPLDELDDDWDIIEATNEIIRLKDVSGGDGSTDLLTFTRTPTTGGGGGSNSANFIENLITDVWYVNLLEDDGVNETCYFASYQFTFDSNQNVVATSSTNTVNGVWVVTSSSSGLDLDLQFEITGDDDPFDELNDDWDVTSFSNALIELMDISGGDGSTDLLNFGRNPYTDCSGANPQDLITIMVNGPWFVASYLDDGNNQTSDYTGYEVTFNNGGTAVATNGTSTFNGSWSVVNSSNGLDVILEFGENPPFDEFNDDWDVSDFSNTVIELVDVSGDGTTDNLVFQKL